MERLSKVPGIKSDPRFQRLKLRQRQLMNQRKQQMQETIRQAEAIEAAKQKITTGGPPSIISKPPSAPTGISGPPSIISKSSPTGTGGPPSIISRPPPSAPTRTGGPPSQGGGGGGPPSQGGGSPQGVGSSRGGGRNPWGRADGGLINFYRYGGFI